MVRALIYTAPAALALAVALIVARAVPRPAAALGQVLWWVLLFVVSAAVLGSAERVGRRFLPLATLLRVSLVFPDRVPSRLGVALKAGSRRRLAQHVAEVQAAREVDEAIRGILALLTSLTTHDRPSRGHSERVRALTDLLAEQLQLPEGDRDLLRWAALLHDIGKLAVAPDVLNKRARLDDLEWEHVRRHPAEGARLVEPLRPFLGSWVDTVGQHHERFDGTGYPAGLAGQEICQGARIVAVADAFEVMTGVRSYRPRLHPDVARKELVANSGTQFDPEVVRAFLNVSIASMQRLLRPMMWFVQVPVVAGIGGGEQAGPGDGGAGDGDDSQDAVADAMRRTMDEDR